MSERLPDHPAEIRDALHRADRLEWWSLFWLILIVVMMGVVGGGSQAFRTAWIEDMLSLLAPAAFLVSRKLETLPERPRFPFGFQRAGSIGFFFAAAALAVIGGFLLYEGVMTLARAEHPTLGSWTILGRQIWLGWLMIGALALSIIPPVMLGRMKRECARRLQDKLLYTDAETNAADWQTGAAGIAGILGIAFGLWWTDAAMAILISVSVLKDGLYGLRVSMTSLLDGAPRRLDSPEIDVEVQRIIERLKARYRNVHVQVRETGRYVRVSIEPDDVHHLPRPIARALVDSDDWRLLDLSVALREGLPDEVDPRAPSA